MNEKIGERIPIPQEMSKWMNEAVAEGKIQARKRYVRRRKYQTIALSLCLLALFMNIEAVAGNLEKLFNLSYVKEKQVIEEGMGQQIGQRYQLSSGKEMSLDYILMDKKSIVLVGRIFDVDWVKDVYENETGLGDWIVLHRSPIRTDRNTLSSEGHDKSYDEKQKVVYVTYRYRLDQIKQENLHTLYYTIGEGLRTQGGKITIDPSKAVSKTFNHRIDTSFRSGKMDFDFEEIYISPINAQLSFRYTFPEKEKHLERYTYRAFSFRLIYDGEREYEQIGVRAIYDREAQEYRGLYEARFPMDNRKFSKVQLYLNESFGEEKVKQRFPLYENKLYEIHSELGQDEFMVVKNIQVVQGKTQIVLATNNTFLSEAEFWIDGRKVSVLNDTSKSIQEEQEGGRDHYKGILSDEESLKYAEYWKNHSNGPDLMTTFILDGVGEQIEMDIKKIDHRIQAKRMIFEKKAEDGYNLN